MDDKECVKLLNDEIESYGTLKHISCHEKRYIEALKSAVKAFEFVDKIKKALSLNDFPEYFQDDAYEILKEYDNYKEGDNG